MLIVGNISSKKEKSEIKVIAQIFAVEERFRYIAQKNKK